MSAMHETHGMMSGFKHRQGIAGTIFRELLATDTEVMDAAGPASDP